MRSHLPCLPCRDRRPALASRGVLIGSTPNTRRSAARASPRQRGAAARGPLPTGCQQHQSERVSRQISVSSARVRSSRRRPSRLLQDHITSTFKPTFPDGRSPSPSRSRDTALGGPEGKDFPPSGRGREGLDLRHGGPVFAIRPDGGTPRTHSGRSSTPAAFRCTLRASAWGRVRRP